MKTKLLLQEHFDFSVAFGRILLWHLEQISRRKWPNNYYKIPINSTSKKLSVSESIQIPHRRL